MDRDMIKIEALPKIQVDAEPLRVASAAAGAGLAAGLLPKLARLSKGLGKGIAGKIAMGVLCTALWGAIKEAPAIWHGVRWVFSAIGTLGDSKATEVIRKTVNKLGEAVDPRADPAPDAPPRPSLKQRAQDFGNKVKAQTKEAVQETSDKIEEKSKPLALKAERAFDNLAGEDRAIPPDAAGFVPPAGFAPPQNAMAGMGQGIANMAEAQKRAEEARLRARAREYGIDDQLPLDTLKAEIGRHELHQRLKLRATQLRIKFDDTWTTERLQLAIVAEDGKRVPNVACPNCKFAFRVNPNSNKPVQCPVARCQNVFRPSTGAAILQSVRPR